MQLAAWVSDGGCVNFPEKKRNRKSFPTGFSFLFWFCAIEDKNWEGFVGFLSPRGLPSQRLLRGRVGFVLSWRWMFGWYVEMLFVCYEF